jgi:very-short-patch-repair endonuclease
VSRLEDDLAFQIRAVGLPEPVREFRFCDRRFRFDFAWPTWKLACEVDGGVWSNGRHTRGAGFERDADKGNLAILNGWRVLHYTAKHIKSGEAVRQIEQMMRRTV